ncbi:accessory Sec system glycosyltransferase GtfA [Streptococcus hongkongensis]|nr:glycosyl transferase family 4 [Streptococcus uberis]
MTLYNINMGIGWASSGVEYAQLYRARLLRQIEVEGKFIFTDLILNENVQHLTKAIGFKDSEVIWMYHYLTDVKLAPTSYTISELEASIPYEIDRREKVGKILRLFYDQGQKFVTCYLTSEDQEFVDRAEFVSDGYLIRKDYFNYTRYCAEFFSPKDNKAHMHLRRFFNEDGSTAFDEIITEDESIFRFKDQIFYSRRGLLSYFLQQFNFGADDIIILDRSSEIGQSVMEEKGQAKLGTVVHAEHYSMNAVTDHHILWNNYYEYEFTHTEDVDFFICSTQAQTDTLVGQFKKYQNAEPKVVTIPVGSLDKLKYPESSRKPFSLLTASRLASEKHIDWLVLAVIEAKKVLPELSFDIYGKGGQEEKLQQLISENSAQEYIHLKGHADLTEIYKNYEAYIAGSTSEGFGLTLMEAVGSGLPIIGFDVPYGNVTFVESGQNGLLIPRQESDQVEQIVDAFAQAIISMYQNYNLQDWQNHSYAIAKDFLSSKVAQDWKVLLEEEGHA